MNFLTRSKKAKSSWEGLGVVVGGMGAGGAGIRVGDNGAASTTIGCFGWPVLARCYKSALEQSLVVFEVDPSDQPPPGHTREKKSGQIPGVTMGQGGQSFFKKEKRKKKKED